MLAYLYERFGEASPLELEEAEKIFSRPFEETEPFGTFTKAVEETSDIAESEKCPHTPAQIVAKSFNCVLKAQNLPDATRREWKHKKKQARLGPTSKPILQRNLGTSKGPRVKI